MKPNKFSVRDAWMAVLILAAQFGATCLGSLLKASAFGVSPVWPASGVSVVALLLLGNRMWPAIFFGNLLANYVLPFPAALAFPFAIGNTIEALAGARIFSMVRRRVESSGGIGELIAILSASALSPVLSASAGVGGLWAIHDTDWSKVGTLWTTWWAGDATGILLSLPPALALASPRLKPFNGNTWLSLIPVISAAALACWMVFDTSWGANFVFVMFPVLLLATWLLGSPGVKVTASAMVFISVWATVQSRGPFADGTLSENLLHLDLFLVSLPLAAMVLSVLADTGSLLRAGSVLVVGWALSGWLFAWLNDERVAVNQAQFDRVTANAEISIQQQMQRYEDVLVASAGYLTASGEVSRENWSRYVSHLRINDRYPGLESIGVIEPVENDRLAEFLRDAKERYGFEFTIRAIESANPPPPLAQRFIATLVEPPVPREPFEGRDFSSEMNRREAAEEARDTGRPVMTRGITIFHDEKRRKGFDLFHPVYRTGMPVSTIAERQTAFRAWVMTPVVFERFLEPYLFSLGGELNLDVFEGSEALAGRRIFGNSQIAAHYLRLSHVQLAGRPWTMGWNRGPNFVRGSSSAPVWASSCAGRAVAAPSLVDYEFTNRWTESERDSRGKNSRSGGVKYSDGAPSRETVGGTLRRR